MLNATPAFWVFSIGYKADELLYMLADSYLGAWFTKVCSKVKISEVRRNVHKHSVMCMEITKKQKQKKSFFCPRLDSGNEHRIVL